MAEVTIAKHRTAEHEPAIGQPHLGAQWKITADAGVTCVEYKDKIIFARLGTLYPSRILRAFWRYLGAG